MPTKPTVYNCHQFNQNVIRFGHLLALILKRATRLCRRWIIFISVYMVYDSSHKFWTTKATKWQFAKKQLADRNVSMEGRKYPSRGVFVVMTIHSIKYGFRTLALEFVNR
jgi:hypothetical protein